MNEPHWVVHRLQRDDPEDFEFLFYCPGCGTGHGFKTDGPGPCWTFNGYMVKPTINPSLLIRCGHGDEPPDVCHSFVRDGQIQFLNDCTHKLAGQTVPLEPP